MLSTSNCGNPSLRHFGFGPTSGEGFGIGYIIKDDSISICASSKHRQTKRFVDSLESYLVEIRRILRATQTKTPAHKASRVREAEERPNFGSRHKSKGRLICAEGAKSPDTVEESKAESEDDGLGGCRPLQPLFPQHVSFMSLLSPPPTPPAIKAAIVNSPCPLRMHVRRRALPRFVHAFH